MCVFTPECACDRSSPGLVRRFTSAFLIVFLLAFGISALPGQTASTGAITGRVLNATNGTYLNNARVALEGSDRVVFTNQYGEYTLPGVPAGPQKVRVFYTGFDSKVTDVTVSAGDTVTADLSLGSAASDTITLDAFTVSAGRETNIAQIATNEQRFAPNVKTVIETNAFGDISEGNTGEFLKYLPGITVEYVAADVRTVNVRGFASAYTSVFIDGFPMASAASGSGTRSFEFEQVSINNASRIEVTKEPTPDVASSALGGSVNMVSKNAFERKGAAFNYSVYANANSEDIIPWKRTPGPKDENSYKVLPGFTFDYTLPVNQKLGFVITGLSSNQFNEQHRSQSTWNFVQAGATPSSPYLQQYSMQDGPKNSYRDSASIRADYRIAPGQSLSAMYQINYYASFFGNRNLNWDVGTAATPTTTGGTALSWGPTLTIGAAGRGSVRHGTSFRDKYGLANAGNVMYRYNVGAWDIDAGLSDSHSRSWYRDTDRGHFSEVRTTMRNVSRVNYIGIENPRPQTIQVVGTDNSFLDYNNLSNYTLNTVRSQPINASDDFKTGHLNAKYKIGGLPFELAIKTGINVQRQERDIRRNDTSWNFVGADGVLNSPDDNAGQYLDTNYGPYSGWGFDNVTWPDPYRLYQEFIAHPNYFQLTTAQALAAERFRIQNSQKLNEDIYAPYFMFDANLLNNRLRVITGVRYENTKDSGDGPYTPTPGATIADVQANWKERGLHVQKTYDGFYPSLHVTYNITEDFLLRTSYARTFGRPDFGQILPLVRVNNTETDASDGIGTIPARTIIYNNTALKPYEANNYDASLEYYFHNGGVVSLGGFWKDAKNFFGTTNGIATAQTLVDLGLPAEDLGFATQTTNNNPNTVHINGIEFNYRQPLNFLPMAWARYFTVYANATKLYLSGGDPTNFQTFVPRAANVGLSFERSKLTLRVNVNFRGREFNSLQTGGQYQVNSATIPSGGQFAEYYGARYNIDMNAAYQINKKFSVFANVRNLLNQPQDLERYNDASPEYSHLYRREKFGAQLTMGVKGSF